MNRSPVDRTRRAGAALLPALPGLPPALLRVLLAASIVGPAPAHGGPADGPVARPLQQFTPPAAGSYALPVIQRSPGGTVLDVDGRAYPLSRYTMGKVTLLSFVYSYCVDPVGCPLAYDSLATLRQRLLRQPALAQQVRLVSLSFDPTNDTPAAMRAYGGAMLDPASPLRWHFLTSRSVAELKPIIDGFGQDVAVNLDERGRPTRLFNHLLKIFLIDAAGRVREIYTTAYLMPDVLFNDVDTVLRADRAASLARRQAPAPRALPQQSALPRADSQELASLRTVLQQPASARSTLQQAVSARSTLQPAPSPRSALQQATSPRIASQQAAARPVAIPQAAARPVATPQATPLQATPLQAAAP